jgi:hypothetical protein
MIPLLAAILGGAKTAAALAGQAGSAIGSGIGHLASSASSLASNAAGLGGGGASAAPLAGSAGATARLAGQGFSGLQVEALKQGALAGTEAAGGGGFGAGLSSMAPGVSNIFGAQTGEALARIGQGLETGNYSRALQGAGMLQGGSPAPSAPLDDSDMIRSRAQVAPPQRRHGRPLRMFVGQR